MKTARVKSAELLNGNHARWLQTGSLLSTQQVMNSIPVEDVIRVLNLLKLRYVLVGAHGISGWRQLPRATADVDVVVMARHHKKAVRAFLEAFTKLEEDDQEVVTRLRDLETKDVKIDVMKTNQPLYKAIFDNSTIVKVQHQEWRIPTLEMALAMKFAAMKSLVRADFKKYGDAGDFIRMVQVNSEIDLEKLSDLGELVYPGGGKELVAKVQQVRRGEKIQL